MEDGMDNKNTGGPAFPVPGDQHDESFNGATLRDYFAAAALATVPRYDPSTNWSSADCADHAYRVADAMLAERAK
jgi:hypothetical protein